MRALPCLLVLLPVAAFAQSQPFALNVAFERSSRTALKVIGTAGIAVDVVSQGTRQTNDIPAVFPLATRDDFVSVTLRGPAGETATTKVEVRAGFQTVFRVELASAAGPVPGGPRFIGKVANTSANCDARERADIRLDFHQGGVKVASVVLALDRPRLDLELAAGSYDVRLFRRNASGELEYSKTEPLSVDRDGWSYAHGCPPTPAGVWKTAAGETVTVTAVGVGQGGLRLFTVDWGSDSGVGILAPDGVHFFFARAPANGGPTSAYIYTLQGGTMSGRFLVSGIFNTAADSPITMGTETATGGNAAGPGGSYSVSGVTPRGTAYTASLSITTASTGWLVLQWSNGIRGIGARVDQMLLAAWGQSGATRFVGLDLDEGMRNARGASVRLDGADVREEILTR